MVSTIPPSVREADEILHRIHVRVAFSRYLNPTNGREARKRFREGGGPPHFEYQSFVEEGDRVLRELDQARPDLDHPAGQLLARCVDGLRRTTLALRDRTSERFDEMNEAAGWYPEPHELTLSFEDDEDDDEAVDVAATDIVAQLRLALETRGMHSWHIELDPVMSARVLVDSAKRLLRVHPMARFRKRDLTRLVVHEIDVHATRGANGQSQALRCFESGVPGSLLTEEGLALVAEEEAGVSAPGVLSRQLEVLRAVQHARTAGFSEVYSAIEERMGRALAWGITQRIKRGLADPEGPGVYAKDTVYLRGRMRVRRFLDEGGDIAHLYVGKVGVDDPVAQWLEEGWVAPRPVPAVWARWARASFG